MSDALRAAAAAPMPRGAVIQGRDVRGPLWLTCDVVVVGSGAGGAAAAYELAAEGFEVLVLEEGGYYRTEDFGPGGPEMTKALYRDAGSSVMFGRPDVLFSEGCAVGGSTLVNGGMCWRTPDAVLARWIAELGLPASRFTPEALGPTFARVEDIIHVAEQSPESIGEDSLRLKRGCDALGYKVVPARRNQRDCVGTSSCIYGCPSGAKQSTLVSYLPRAVGHGARIYADTRARRIRVDRAGHATGVEAVVRDPVTERRWPMNVSARAVVVAGGAIQTPLLLQSSHLGNRWVGRNLLAHPNVKVLGVYDERVDGWKGVIQGFQIHEFLDEGLLMSTSFVPPSLIGPTMPLIGDELMTIMREFNHMITAGVLLEDSTSGTVRRAPGGEPLMRYQLTDADLKRLVRGVALLAEIFFASGARDVYLPLDGLPALHSVDEIPLLLKHPVDPAEFEVLTVHAMGTARMAGRPELGATSPDGELWEHPGVYVADASLLPTPIGLNPQVTIMALATEVARAVAERLRG